MCRASAGHMCARVLIKSNYCCIHILHSVVGWLSVTDKAARCQWASWVCCLTHSTGLMSPASLSLSPLLYRSLLLTKPLAFSPRSD